MKSVPSIEKYMTPVPHTINPKMPLKKAIEMMRENHIRHVPVLEAGKVIGILSDRDVQWASTFNEQKETLVEEVMTPDPYTVRPYTLLDEVVFHMAEHRYGCAVISQINGKVLGIFTATDGLRLLGEILYTRSDERAS